MHQMKMKSQLPALRAPTPAPEETAFCHYCRHAVTQVSQEVAVGLRRMQGKENQEPATAAAAYHSPQSSEPQTSCSPTSVPTLLASSPAISPSFELIDLVLMNHFTAVTSLNLFSGEHQNQLWQRDVPSQAGSNAMLMHGILAVAALDLSRSSSTPIEHQARAFYHHGLGLQLFKPEIADISPQNFDILFTFAILLVVWVYASPAAGNGLLGLDDILDKLEMVRGCKKLFHMHGEAIRDKPIATFARSAFSKNVIGLSSPANETFSYLRTLSTETINLVAIDQLQRNLQKLVEAGVDTKTAAAWPAIISDEFWARLRAHESVPVLIFAHHAIVSGACADQWWWMAGWSERVLQATGNALTDTDKTFFDWENLSTQIRSQAAAVSTDANSTSSGAANELSSR
ncbi:hypothetical protein H2200_010853 [Cladophialophora chaetospira]|uniref:Uncharacterized protein n=1 Tax=Cladophialophora chaetospira TaxID=386627 RepID=A0AA38X0W6_9EURO|nr:hypothetical protein H2200_010853 [Cladophialophora chaetospira]